MRGSLEREGAQRGASPPFRPHIWPCVPLLTPKSHPQCCPPPGTSSMKILMKPSWLMEPKYCTMFLCRRCLCKAISSCKDCEYLHGGTPG